jgi:hypothetical protein
MPSTSARNDRDGPTDRRGDHPKHGLGYWLDRAPSWTTFAKVKRAAREHDDPSEVWVTENATDHRLKRVPGPLDGVECTSCGARCLSVDEFHAIACRGEEQ